MPRIKTERLELRLTLEQKQKLAEISKKSRMNMTEYIVAISEQKKIIVADGVPELLKQIIKIGTNVNQITMVANSNHSVASKQIDIVNTNLVKIQNLISDLIDEIKNAKDEIEV